MIVTDSISWFCKIFKSKWGRFYPLRNLVVGWISHSLQDRDKSEIAVHVAVEVILICGLLVVLDPGNVLVNLIKAFLLAHTLMFVIDGQLHSYLHDSIEWMKNAGAEEAVSYLAEVRRLYAASDSAYAVLVYGSFCRKEFHRRSDLDIRVIRRPGLRFLFKSIALAQRLRFLSVWKRLPTDILVVDGMGYVRRQMSVREAPVVLFLREGFSVPEAGMDFESIIADPSIVLKKETKG